MGKKTLRKTVPGRSLYKFRRGSNGEKNVDKWSCPSRLGKMAVNKNGGQFYLGVKSRLPSEGQKKDKGLMGRRTRILDRHFQGQDLERESLNFESGKRGNGEGSENI